MKKLLMIAVAAATMTMSGCSCISRTESVVVMADSGFEWDGNIRVTNYTKLFGGWETRRIELKSKDGRTIEIDPRGPHTVVTRTGWAKQKKRTPTTRSGDATTMHHRTSDNRAPTGEKYTTSADE